MSEELNKYIGEHLRALRQKRGMTQAQLAQAAKTKTNYYSKVERGEVTPSIKLLGKLVRALDADYRDILP